MFKHILIATDGSELAGKAVEHGLTLAKELGARVTIVAVTEAIGANLPWEVAAVMSQEEYEKGVSRYANAVLAAATDRAHQMSISCSAVHVKDRLPAEGILEAAKANGCELIVMSSHGRRGLSKLLLGSQASAVLARADVPVLICR